MMSLIVSNFVLFFPRDVLFWMRSGTELSSEEFIDEAEAMAGYILYT